MACTQENRGVYIDVRKTELHVEAKAVDGQLLLELALVSEQASEQCFAFHDIWVVRLRL
jgi:hypothetical protein